MATENSPPAAGRPRTWLVVTFGVVLTLFLLIKFWPSSPTPSVAPARTQARAAKAADNGTVDPEELKVRLEALKDPRPEPAAGERNPFRFYQKPPPPLPVNPTPRFTPSEPVVPTTPVIPPPPPIPLKYIALVEGKGVGKVAAFSDCKRTFYGREGDIVDGRYRLVKIGIESVTMMYLDGRGQQTIRLSGQDCIGK